jgi:hypothetical protein
VTPGQVRPGAWPSARTGRPWPPAWSRARSACGTWPPDGRSRAWPDTGAARAGSAFTPNSISEVSISEVSGGRNGIDLFHGGNDNLAAPSLTAAASTAGTTVVTGTLTSTPNTSFALQFFSSGSDSPPQGQAYMDHDLTVATNSSGQASFTLSMTAAVSVGDFLTATATSLTAGGTRVETSRISAGVQVVAAKAPAITSAASTSFTVGSAGSFTIMTTGTPTASLTEAGVLPSGVTFTDHGNGTASLAGAPAPGSAGTYAFTITAHNGVSPDAAQAFTLVVPVDGITAQLVSVKVGKKRRLMVAVLFADTGALKEEVPCPFQRPAFKNIRVGVVEPDTVVVSARKGKRTVTITFPG